MVDVMRYMDPGNTGEVSFPMFRNWLLDTQLHWSSLLVLPEGTVAALRRQATFQLRKLPTDHDPAKTEWKRLSLLLKAMGEVVEYWGQPGDMYGQHIIKLEKKIGNLLAPQESFADAQDEQTSDAEAAESAGGAAPEAAEAHCTKQQAV